MMGKTAMPVRYKIQTIQLTGDDNNFAVKTPKNVKFKGDISKTTYDYINNGFAVIRNAIPKEIIQFALDTWKTMEHQPEYNKFFEREEIITTEHVPDESKNKSNGNHNLPMGVAMQELMWGILKKNFDFDLIPTYSYTRKYDRGAYLGVHSDRPECEVSTTICLDYKTDDNKPWKIWVDNTKNWTMTNWNEDAKAETQGIPIRKRKSIAIELEPGDILLYQGPNVAHWRDTLMGDYSYHMFIHFYMTKGAVGQNVGEEMAYDWIGSKYLSTEQRPAEKSKRQIEWHKAYSITKNESSENNFDEYTTEKIEDDSI